MTERMGRVIETESAGKYAHVVTDRKTACGGCHVIKSACYGCLTNTKVVSRVANPVGAKAGDLVKIKLSASKLFTAAAIFYLIPVFAIIIGAFSGPSIFAAYGLAENFASICGAGTGLVLALIIVTILGRLPILSQKMEPAISTIVMSQGVS